MPLHSSLTGSELHENKGVATATTGTVATASSGATVWQKIKTANIDTTDIFTTNVQTLTAVIDDVSTASTIYLAMPYDCTVEKIVTVLGNAVTVADSTITCRNHVGTSMGTITVAYSGSGAGDVDSLLPTSNNTFSADEKMQIDTDGGSTTLSKLYITVQVTVTG